MIIRKLFESKEEYLQFFQFLLSWTLPRSIWREEDLPNLEPYFQFCRSNRNKMTDEESVSFEFYKKCLEDYGETNIGFRDALVDIAPEDLAKEMGVEFIEDEWILSDKVDRFPVLLIGAIESDHHHLVEKCSLLYLDLVYSEDFLATK